MNAAVHTTRSISPGRLWFGFAAAPVAWALHGLTSFFISWQSCQDGDADWGLLSELEVRWLLIAVSLVLLGVAIASSVTSLLSWRRLDTGEQITRSLAEERLAFMCLLGFFVGLVMVIGILWGSLGPVLVEVCEKAR